MQLMLAFLNFLVPPVGIAALIHRKFRQRYAFSEILLIGFLIFLAGDIVVLKVIKYLGVPYLTSVYWVNVAVTGGGLLAAGLLARRQGAFWRRIHFKWVSHWRLGKGHKRIAAFYGLIAAMLLVQVVKIAVMPLYDFDGRWYHAGKISLMNHKFDLLPPRDVDGSVHLRYVYAYPDDAECLFAHGAAFVGPSGDLRFVQLYVNAIGGLALYVFLRRWRVPRFTAEMIALGFLSLPAVMMQQQSLYIDGIFASFALIAFALQPRREPDWRDAALFLTANALLIGTKTTGIVVVAANCLALLVLRRNQFRPLARAFLKPQVLPVLLACLALAGETYAFNARYFGNPIYPIAKKILGIELPGRINEASAEYLDGNAGATKPEFFQRNPAVKTFLSVAERDIWRPEVPPVLTASRNGFGPLVSIVMLPAALLCIFLMPALDWAALMLLLAVPLFLMQPVQYLVRYILFIYAPLAVFTGVFLAHCRPGVRTMLTQYVMLLVAVNCGIGLYNPGDREGRVAFEQMLRPPAFVENGNSHINNALAMTAGRDVYAYSLSNNHTQMIYRAGRDFSNHLHFYKNADELAALKPGALVIVPKSPGKDVLGKGILAKQYRVLDDEAGETLFERL